VVGWRVELVFDASQTPEMMLQIAAWRALGENRCIAIAVVCCVSVRFSLRQTADGRRHCIVTRLSHPGVLAGLAAAALFGAGTPLAKLLLAQANPLMLAGLLYLGSGLGLWLLRLALRAPRVQLGAGEWRWLAGAILSGGLAAPVLLMVGLAAMPASGAALLLNAEVVFTALLAWVVFKENFDRRVALGMLCIVAGALVLGWPQDGQVRLASLWPSVAVLGACLCWAIDNNLTRKIALADAVWITMIKGLAAGLTNLVLALAMGAAWPGAGATLGAAAVGFVSYGASLTLFVLALRHLGAARAGAYFSIGPFFGASLALLLLDEPLTRNLLLGGALMALGVALNLMERHAHEHHHEALEHDHKHTHGAGDPHHEHEHDAALGLAAPSGPVQSHKHRHQHQALSHSHAHFPDAHHLHEH
jgi:drug/metabolite transporter (DMT)-like permease